MQTNFENLEGFEWDQGNLEHIKKHGVTKEECEEVFYNQPFLIHEDSRHSSDKEGRFQILGQTNQGRKLFLAITVRNNKTRVISARDQNKKERRVDEKES